MGHLIKKALEVVDACGYSTRMDQADRVVVVRHAEVRIIYLEPTVLRNVLALEEGWWDEVETDHISVGVIRGEVSRPKYHKSFSESASNRPSWFWCLPLPRSGSDVENNRPGGASWCEVPFDSLPPREKASQMQLQGIVPY